MFKVIYFSAGSSTLRSRRLEVVGERENGRPRGLFFLSAHNFQAPATQVKDRRQRALQAAILTEFYLDFI